MYQQCLESKGRPGIAAGQSYHVIKWIRLGLTRESEPYHKYKRSYGLEEIPPGGDPNHEEYTGGQVGKWCAGRRVRICCGRLDGVAEDDNIETIFPIYFKTSSGEFG